MFGFHALLSYETILHKPMIFYMAFLQHPGFVLRNSMPIKPGR